MMNKKCIFKVDDRLEFQADTANRLLENLSKEMARGAVIGDGVGMGKTYTSLFCAFSYMKDYLNNSKQTRKKFTSILIVVPNDAILKKWQAELTPYAKPGNFSEYIRGIKYYPKIISKLLKLINNTKSYDEINKYRENIRKRISWSVILMKKSQMKQLCTKKSNLYKELKFVTGFLIIDEAHHLKEPSMKKLFKEKHCELMDMSANGGYAPRFLLLTATPFQKKISQIEIIMANENFLDKKKDYEALKDHVNNIQGALQSRRLPEKDFYRLRKKSHELSDKMKYYMVINPLELRFENKNSRIKRYEFINGQPMKKKILDTRQDFELGRKIFENNADMRMKLSQFHKDYLHHRFSMKGKKYIESYLERFTSFQPEKPNALKVEVLKQIIQTHLSQTHNIWNQKFIVFCDMVNDTNKKVLLKGRNRLHDKIRKACENTINIGKYEKVDSPNFYSILGKTFRKTALEFVFFKLKGNKELRPKWEERITRWHHTLQSSNLYHYYGIDMKKYYEQKFLEMSIRFAVKSFIYKRLEKLENDSVKKKRVKSEIESIFKNSALKKRYAGLSGYKLIGMNLQSMLHMWQLYWENEKNTKRKKRGSNALKSLISVLKKDRKRLLKQFEGEFPRHNPRLVEVFNGEKKNLEALRAYQTPLEPIALVVSSAGEEGIDLQAFTKGIIHYDFCWSPGKMVQREGRVDRIGSAVEMYGKHELFKKKELGLRKHIKNRGLQVHYLMIPDTYDERKYMRMRERQRLFRLLVPSNLEDERINIEGSMSEKKLSRLCIKLSVVRGR